MSYVVSTFTDFGHHWVSCFNLKNVNELNLQILFQTFILKGKQIMNIESKENKSKLVSFTIAAEVTVTVTPADNLHSRVCSEDATSTN